MPNGVSVDRKRHRPDPAFAAIRALALAASLPLAACSSSSPWVDLYQRASRGDMGAVEALHASAARNARAAFLYGLLEEKQTHPDLAEACRWYELAVLRVPAARHNLALLELRGTPAEVHDPARVSPHPELKDRLFREEAALPPSDLDPISLLESSARDNQVPSMLLLASILEYGLGTVQASPARAAQWYRAAIDYSNDPRAIARLGAMTFDGRGVDPSAKVGRQMLETAAAAGVLEAAEKLAAIAPSTLEAARWQLITDAMAGRDAASSSTSRVLELLSPPDREIASRDAAVWRHVNRAADPLPPFATPIDAL